MGEVVALSRQPPSTGDEPEADERFWITEHARLVEMFEESEDAGRSNRESAERDVDYYDGKQWTEKEAATLRRRGQAALMDNVIKPKIRFLQGLEQTRRTDPRALPRTAQHEEDSHSATDALRFVMDENRYDNIRSKGFKDVLSAGWGGYEVTVENRPGRTNPTIAIRRCQWDRMGWDPYSGEDNFEDAGYRFLLRWLDKEDAIREYGDDGGRVFDETVAWGRAGGTFDDKPKHTTWVSYAQKRWRVCIVQMYFRGPDGDVRLAEFTKGGILHYGPSPWLDEFGEPEDPYAWGSANVDRDNQRYGEIRHLIDLQDGINHRTAKFQHLVSVRQTYGTERALGRMTVQQLRAELAKPDGHLSMAEGTEYGKHFGVVPTGDMADAQLALLQQHISRLAAQGPNASMQGKDPRLQSGRAIMAQQEGGSIEAAPVFDVLREMDMQLYRKVWNRIRQFWTAEQWVRVTDDMKNVRFVVMNEPMTDEFGQPAVDPMTGQPMLRNAVAELDIDIIVDDAPHVGTLQDEEFSRFVELAKISPEIAQAPAEFWLELSSVRNKAKAAQALQQRREPDPMAVEGAKAELQNKQADTANKAASAQKNEAQARQTLAQIGLSLMALGQPPPMPVDPMQPQPQAPAQPGAF